MAEKIYYKYRAFNEILLANLLNERVYFPNPAKLNDPFESSPCLNMDVDNCTAETLLNKILKKITLNKKEENLNFEDLIERIKQLAEHRVDYHEHEKNHDYWNNIDEYNRKSLEDAYSNILKSYIEHFIKEFYPVGVFSLSTKYDCPLLWSHYGEQHKGICIGYSIPNDMKKCLFKVEYENDRSISASDLIRMIDGDAEAKKRVDRALLRRKGIAWRYEKEWRLIHKEGVSELEIEIREIIFGMRCDLDRRQIIVRSLKDRLGVINYYEINPKINYSLLERSKYDENINVLINPPKSLEQNRLILSAFSNINLI